MEKQERGIRKSWMCICAELKLHPECCREPLGFSLEDWHRVRYSNALWRDHLRKLCGFSRKYDKGAVTEGRQRWSHIQEQLVIATMQGARQREEQRMGLRMGIDCLGPPWCRCWGNRKRGKLYRKKTEFVLESTGFGRVVQRGMSLHEPTQLQIQMRHADQTDRKKLGPHWILWLFLTWGPPLNQCPEILGNYLGWNAASKAG